jgi:hypothetical protein
MKYFRMIRSNNNQIEPAAGRVKKEENGTQYFKLTFNQLLNVLCAIAVPVSIGIYTAVTTSAIIKRC